jgi:ABC-2 type transport system permease protein
MIAMRIIYALWLRQVKKYARSRSRVVGAVGQPLLFLLALGYGLGSVYARAGRGDYIQFLVPGVIVQTILFASIFWGVNILFDKMFGFLKEMMVAPVPRLVVLLGSVLGGATTAFVQGLLVLIVSLAIGFHPYSWSLLLVALAVMGMLAVAITSLGAGLGSIIDNMPGFQAVNNFVIFPLYFLSSALYPLDTAPQALRVIASVNPLSYAVDALRGALINQTHFGFAADFTALGITVVALVAFGTYCFQRIEV